MTSEPLRYEAVMKYLCSHHESGIPEHEQCVNCAARAGENGWCGPCAAELFPPGWDRQ